MYNVNRVGIENAKNSISLFICLSLTNSIFVFMNIPISFIFSDFISFVGAVLLHMRVYHMIAYSCFLIPLVLLGLSCYLADKNKFGFILAIIVSILDILVIVYLCIYISGFSWFYVLPVIGDGWLIIDCAKGLHNFNILEKFKDNE